MTSRAVVRYATKADLEKFYGTEDTMYFSARAVVVDLDGEILGVGGVYRVKHQMQVFSDVRSDKISSRDIIKAAHMVMRIINRYTAVVAYTDPDKGTALGFAKHFGFQPTGVQYEGGQQLYRMRE